MRIKPGFSFAGKNYGLLVDSSAMAALPVGVDEEEGALEESKAIND